MSLLQSQGAPDEAARGESFTKGTSPLVWAAIAAAVIVSVAIAVYFIAGQKPPVAAIEIVDVWAHPRHEVTPGFDAAGSSVSESAFDEVLVFTRVRLRNQSKGPIFLHQIMTNVTLADGNIDSSFATSPSQYERVFQAYPELKPWHATPLKTEQTLEAGQAVEGTFVSSLRITRQQWEARKALDYTFGFRYQPEVKVPVKLAVIDR